MIPLDDLIVYQRAMDLGDIVWSTVKDWEYFAKQTIGRQLVRSADSVSANIAEGHGRYHYGDRRQFAYYARGSLYESETWLRKSATRQLIPPHLVKELNEQTGELGRILNGYINTSAASNRNRRTLDVWLLRIADP